MTRVTTSSTLNRFIASQVLRQMCLSFTQSIGICLSTSRTLRNSRTKFSSSQSTALTELPCLSPLLSRLLSMSVRKSEQVSAIPLLPGLPWHLPWFPRWKPRLALRNRLFYAIICLYSRQSLAVFSRKLNFLVYLPEQLRRRVFTISLLRCFSAYSCSLYSYL